MKTSLASSINARVGAWTGRPAFWIAAVGVLFAFPLVRGLTQPAPPPPPPVLAAFPPAALAVAERSLLAPALHGRAFVTGVLCESCAGPMRVLQHRTRNLGDALWLVSFAQAAASAEDLARANGAGPRWRFVSSSPAAMLESLGDPMSVVLVDPQARIRGRYRIGESSEMDRLLRDCVLVAALR